MPLSGTAYDPDTLAMLYRALDSAFSQLIADPTYLDATQHQAVRQKLARALIQAYEDGEEDPELLTTIAVRSYRREA